MKFSLKDTSILLFHIENSPLNLTGWMLKLDIFLLLSQ